MVRMLCVWLCLNRTKELSTVSRQFHIPCA
uniref:Uncharacterized protein n=1 Tax=Setaria italica TaxID=4555 RepID=K4APC0_SETIT